MFLFLLACAHVHVVSAPEMVKNLDPTSSPLAPFDPPHPKAESMNTEYYLGSREEEQKQFAAFAEQIQMIQNKQSGDRNQPMQRGFHGKSHGCFEGELVLREDRDERTRFGVFADEYQRWPIWVRLSNGVGWKQADKELDARGFAMKLMGVPGEKLTDDEKETQDFLLTNSAGPVGKNASEFMKFAHTNSKGKVPTILYAISKPTTVLPAVIDTQPVNSMMATQYWSGGAYHLGAHQAVKMTVKNCTPYKNKPNKKDPDFLSHDLESAIQDDLCFTLYAQFQVDPKSTPIENAAIRWKTSISPEIPIADIRLPAQDFLNQEHKDFCEKLSFNPWHAIGAHQPMGHINRARRFVYEASRNHRGGSVEPMISSPEEATPIKSKDVQEGEEVQEDINNSPVDSSKKNP